MNKRSTLALSLAVVALALALVAGMALPTAASAAGKKPVVKSITPKKWSTAGGAVVTVTGKNFKLGGKKVVKSVRFGAKAGKKLKVRSATKLTVVAPAGKGTVHIRVVTTRGTSRAVRADRFTYLGPARAIVVRSGDGQTVSAGISVPIKPSVVVRDAGSGLGCATVTGYTSTCAKSTRPAPHSTAHATLDQRRIRWPGRNASGMSPNTSPSTVTTKIPTRPEKPKASRMDRGETRGGN